MSLGGRRQDRAASYKPLEAEPAALVVARAWVVAEVSASGQVHAVLVASSISVLGRMEPGE